MKGFKYGFHGSLTDLMLMMGYFPSRNNTPVRLDDGKLSYEQLDYEFYLFVRRVSRKLNRPVLRRDLDRLENVFNDNQLEMTIKATYSEGEYIMITTRALRYTRNGDLP